MALTPVDEVDHGPDKPPLRLVAPAEVMQSGAASAYQPKEASPRHISPADEPYRPQALEARQAQPPRPIFPAAEVMTVIEALLKITALRLLLFVAFGVMSYLGYLTVFEPNAARIVAMCLWAGVAFIPVVWLVGRRG